MKPWHVSDADLEIFLQRTLYMSVNVCVCVCEENLRAYLIEEFNQIEKNKISQCCLSLILL